MAKRNTRRTGASTRRSSQAAPGWFWFFGGLSLGLAVAVLVYVTQPNTVVMPQQVVTPNTSDQPKAEPPKEEKELKAEVEEEAEPTKHFDFYTLLPELEVVVPDDPEEDTLAPTTEAVTPVEPEAQVATSKPVTSSSRYVVQAGSFKNLKDADAQKARLALMGLDVSIQKAKLGNDDTTHRVYVGPYERFSEVQKVEARLNKQKIETLVLREKK